MRTLERAASHQAARALTPIRSEPNVDPLVGSCRFLARLSGQNLAVGFGRLRRLDECAGPQVMRQDDVQLRGEQQELRPQVHPAEQADHDREQAVDVGGIADW